MYSYKFLSAIALVAMAIASQSTTSHAQAATQGVMSQAQSQATEEVYRAYNPAGPADPAAVARGEKIYRSTCAFCHGADATGGTGPNLLDQPLVLHDQNGSTLGPFLRKGLPSQGMPAFASLSSAQVADISSFLHDRIGIAADRFAQKLPEIVTGSADMGQTYFREKCATCHSVTGDLAHIATKYQPAELMSQICYPRPSGYFSQVPADAMATVTLPSGQVISGKLLHLDEFNVELLGQDGSSHVYSVVGAKVEVNNPVAAHVALLRQYTDADLRNLVAYLEAFK